MIIKTKLGDIQGEISESIGLFKGIPYAKSPLKTGVFKRPVSIDKYNGLVDATNFKNKAPQPKVGQISTENDLLQSLDCLYLNIWAPININEKKPVVVWIHGGAFVMGETATKMYDGHSFAKNGDIVFVSIQYRLGLYGFTDFSYLSDEKNIFESNVGLFDQVEALHWIRQNIDFFGGDPNNITLMGESAGASSILCLMTSPISQPLFHKVILQSPTTHCVLSKEQAHFWAKKALEYGGNLSLESIDLDDSFIDKANLIAKSMMESFTDLTPGSWAFGPVVDGLLMTETIIQAFNSGHFSNIPMLIGTNKDEAALFVREKEPWLPSNANHMDLFFKQNSHLPKNEILNNYPEYPSSKSLKDIGRDFCFSSGVTFISDAHSKFNDTYVYRFDYETKVAQKLGIGAFHGAEIMYAFSNLDSELSKLVIYDLEDAIRVSDFIHQSWIRFIKYGNPNQDAQLWDKYSYKTRNTLCINLEKHQVHDPEHKARTVWKQLFIK